MTNPYRNIAIVAVIAAVIVLGIALPRHWRQDNPNIDPAIRTALREQVQISFDAPLLELLGGTVIRLDSYDTKTGNAKAGAFAWFGFRVATIRLEKCQYWKNGAITETFFACNGGGSISYGSK